MKRIALCLVLSASLFTAKSQLLIHGDLEDVYRNFMVQAHSQFSKSILNDFIGVGGDQRFFSNKWLNGGATNNFEVTISQNYTFNYDFLGQELHAKWRDTSIVVNTNYVKRFFLNDGFNSHVFVKSPALDPSGQQFYESLAFDEASHDSAKIQLLKARTVKKIRANKDAYLANFEGDYSDEFKNTIDYYVVFPNKTYSKVKLSKKSLSDAFSKYSDKVATYFKQVDKVDEESAAGLIRYLNQQ